MDLLYNTGIDCEDLRPEKIQNEDDPQEDGGLPELRKKLAGITAVFCDQ